MNKYIKTLCSIAIAVSIAVAVWIVSTTPLALAEEENNHEVKNIIFMVPDGMGLPDVTAARIYKNGLEGPPLNLETLENIGYQRTYSADSTITDSAAAASTWACGEKFNNIEVCAHSDGRPHNPGILELARDKGKATGLVATYTITHATPAAFGAHVTNRSCENEIARQYIEDTEPDVMFGGGISKFNSTEPDACGTSGNFIPEAVNKGYTLVYTKDEMQSAANNGAKKMLGLFSDSYLVPESQRAGTTEPGLSEMTAAALDVLEEDKDGFFLMVEGSQVDGANHVNNMSYQINEVLAFDEAVKIVLDWINANPERKENTLLIVVPDHDTGGFAINGPYNLIRAGEYVIPGWTTRGHTGVDTIIWSQGPGSQPLGRALDNTDLYRVMVKSLDIKEKHIEKHSNVKSKLIEKRIEKGLEYLHEKQLPNGEFQIYNSYLPDMSDEGNLTKNLLGINLNLTTVFDTGFILHTLNMVDNKKSEGIVQEMRTKSASFLLDNRELHGVWRFWGKNQPIVPPDTDDTAVIFASLVESRINISDESLDYMLGYRNSEGVFYTWINSEEWLSPSNPGYAYFKKNNIDANVNADVLYAYSLKNRTQDGIIRYLNNVVENKSFLNGTIYYPSPYAFSYLITKAYSEGRVRELEPSMKDIKDYVLETQKPDGSWGNDMDTALATISLLNVGYEGEQLNKAIGNLMNKQNENGSWDIYGFYIATSYPPVYYGSQALTTSFSIEALTKYKETIDD